MTVNTNIIRIGNSNGIIIPMKMLRTLNLSEKDQIEISTHNGELRIRNASSENVFSVLDRWNEEHGFQSENVEEVERYLDSIRESRFNKQIPEW